VWSKRFLHPLLCVGIALPIHTPVRAQGTCGAAGGAPAGPAWSVCDFAREAGVLSAPGPATGVGNPIDLATGNKYRGELDLRINAHLPLVFARHYNSRNRFDTVLGVGWSHSFETRLVPVTVKGRKELQVIQGDGRRIVFEPMNHRFGQWRSQSLASGRIESHRSKSVAWTWYMPDGRALQFDAKGHLQFILRDGLTVMVFSRTPQGRLTHVSGPDRWVLEFHYTDHRHGLRLHSVEVLGEAIARFTYDESGQLATVTWRDGRGRRYEYDDPRDPLLLTGVLNVEANPDGLRHRVARYAYDIQGRAVSTVEGDGGTSLQVRYLARQSGRSPGFTSVTDSQGRQAAYRWHYDRHHHTTRLLESVGQPCNSCGPTRRRYQWDAQHRLQSVLTDRETVHFEHDRIGRPVAAWRREAKGQRTLLWRLAYARNDLFAQPAVIEQPSVAPGRLHRIRIERDALGRPLAVSEEGFRPTPGPGHSARAAPRFVPITRRFSMGHRQFDSTRADPFEPLPANWLTGLAWVDGPMPGPSDRIELTQFHASLNAKHPHGVVETLAFQNGLLAEHINSRGQAARMEHSDPKKQWLGGPTLFGAYIGSAKLDLEYNDFGVLQGLLLTDFSGKPPRQLNTNQPGSIESADPARHRAIEIRHGHPSVIELPDGAHFRRGFDDFGRVAWIEQPDQARQWGEYDESDRLIAHHPGDGSIVRYQRDAQGRLIEATRTGPSGTTLMGRYRWEGARLAHAENDTVSIAYEWDRLDRLIATEHRFATTPQQPLRHAWQYDLAGRIAAETLPGGVIVRYRHQGRDIVGIDVAGLGRSGALFQSVDASQLTRPLRIAAFDSQEASPDQGIHEAGRLIEAGGMRHLQDPHGLRAAIQSIGSPGTPSSGTDFVHQDWRLRTERTAQGKVRNWIWAGTRPIALIESGQLYRIVTDTRAAPVQALDHQSRVVWSAEYNHAGAARIEGNPRVNIALRLPGQYFDAHTGWHYNHFRTYSPASKRYLEPDPLGLQADTLSRDALTEYASGDPVGHLDPWGLATLSWFAITTNATGQSLGRTQGFDNARWSFMIESILPVPLVGTGLYPPQPAGIGGVLFDPWGDFISGANAPFNPLGNGIDSIAWTGATGRQVFASFAAHYGGAMASPQRFIIEGFDDRRAGALALILAASPSQRQACIGKALTSLPGIRLGPSEPLLQPTSSDSRGPARVLECQAPTPLPVPYADELERSRVERYQAAAELQESPSASIGENCAASNGCRSRARIDVNGRAYYASYGRTQFTVTTFLGELGRMTQPSANVETLALRAALKLDTPITLDGRAATLGDALVLARQRVEAAYRSFAAIRIEFGRGLDAVRASEIWNGLSEARRLAFSQSTGLGQDGFIDMLGYVATGIGGRTEEEGRHALAASAAATVRYLATDTARASSFDQWLIDLYSSRAPYDHVSRAFLRDNLRRVLASPRLAGRFNNSAQADTPAWFARQAEIELDLAQRVAVLHNAGRLDLATSPSLDAWLTSNRTSWITGYVTQFTTTDGRGNWEALRCTTGIGARAGLQLTPLGAMPK